MSIAYPVQHTGNQRLNRYIQLVGSIANGQAGDLGRIYDDVQRIESYPDDQKLHFRRITDSNEEKDYPPPNNNYRLMKRTSKGSFRKRARQVADKLQKPITDYFLPVGSALFGRPSGLRSLKFYGPRRFWFSKRYGFTPRHSDKYRNVIRF